jgi:hypothetical protein
MRGSSKQVSLEDVWDHYEVTRDSLVQRKEKIEQNLLSGCGSTEPRFVGTNLNDVEVFFNNELNEAHTEKYIIKFEYDLTKCIELVFDALKSKKYFG